MPEHYLLDFDERHALHHTVSSCVIYTGCSYDISHSISPDYDSRDGKLED